MNAAEPEGPQPPKVLLLSPTEMRGDWAAEVQKKLVDQGVDPQLASRIAGAAEAEAAQLASPRPSFRRRLLRFFGLAD